MEMILIADSGSTKTDWALAGADGTVDRVQTQGINPFHQDGHTISMIIERELCSHIDAAAVTEVVFYGSGVRPELQIPMETLLQRHFPESRSVSAYSDLLGAARALCQHERGVACILGTGANSCLYDGERILQNTPALGYVLGDEGSGAVLGVRFLNALYKNRLPDHVARAFEDEMHLQMADVIERVYRQPLPNRFLASMAQFVGKLIDVPELQQLVVENFCNFLRCNVAAYGKDSPVGVVGSMAYHFESQWVRAIELEGFVKGKILKSPIEGLVQYHLG